jgi:hypothetical protein
MVRRSSLAAGRMLATLCMAQAATPGPGYDIEISRTIFHDGHHASVLQLPLAAAHVAVHRGWLA